MPAGLDGNPDPVRTPQRDAVIARAVADIVANRRDRGPTLVAIDGIDGAGKSTFADELSRELEAADEQVIRSTIDWFHRPRAERMARGRRSPVGFYLDSHDLDALQERLLRPLRSEPGADYRVAAFDEPNDEPLDPTPEKVVGTEILLFDGIFLNRPELAGWWDFSIFLDGFERVNEGRLGLVVADRPDDPDEVIGHVLDWVARIDRYSSGMRYYLDLVDPAARADLVIDNNDFERPRII